MKKVSRKERKSNVSDDWDLNLWVNHDAIDQ